jgi:hypothetical protein
VRESGRQARRSGRPPVSAVASPTADLDYLAAGGRSACVRSGLVLGQRGPRRTTRPISMQRRSRRMTR